MTSWGGMVVYSEQSKLLGFYFKFSILGEVNMFSLTCVHFL